jgi:cyclase
MIPYTAGLHRLTERSYAYLRPPGTWGLSNCGVVVDGGEAVLVDNQFDLSSTTTLVETLAAGLPGTVVTTVVNTHANGDHCWGNQLFPDAVIVGSAASADGMAHEIQPAALAAMSGPASPDSVLGGYLRRHFGRFDFSGIVVTPPTRTFTGRTELVVGGRTLELVEVGPAHTDGDVIVHVPDDRVVFAGDILFIGDHPIAWTGPLENCVKACSRIAAMDAEFIVPGHGPVTDTAGVLQFRDYLEYVAENGAEAYAGGVPYWQAAMDMPMPQAYASWGHRERLVITLAAHYRHLGSTEPAPLPEVLHHVAAMAQRFR